MKTPPYEALFAAREILVLQRESGRTFSAPGLRPDWFRLIAPEEPAAEQLFEPAQFFPYLDHFLEDAETFWSSTAASELRSGIWSENSPEGPDLQFEAVACRADGGDYLLVQRLTTGFDELHRVFQKGRELSLTHERLVAEIGKKEILLHCIVHDMAGPLQSMMGAIHLAKSGKQPPTVSRMLELGLLAAKQQSNFINDLLDTFRTELSAIQVFSSDPETAPDAVASACAVVEMLQPAFAIRELRGEVSRASQLAVLRVAAEKSRLERVLHNLLQNAMRYSPRGSTVTVSLREDEEFVRIAVEDQGPGVPAEVVPQLFQKFVRHGSTSGNAGLGLFFCRITVEQWGGTIGCEPRRGGGTTFWFRLKRV